MPKTLWFEEKSVQTGWGVALHITKKLHEEQSSFQKIEVYQTTNFGNLLVLDGFIMLTERDNFQYHEMLVHPPLLCHPAAKRILIIGGGDCGSLKEVLKHKQVQTAIQVDIDERVTRVCEDYFPDLVTSNDDQRATLLFADGIDYLAKVPANSFDVIIVDSTDPVGPGMVLYATEFYQSCFQALGDSGLLVVQSESPLLHADLIEKIRANMTTAGFSQLNSYHFPVSTYPSGWWSATMAGKENSSLSIKNRDIKIQNCVVFTPEFYQGCVLSEARLKKLRELKFQPG
ncbi:MAG TPA: polyamine aminopropyltransferase [Gammaproteobacteria bacterium]|nr:polyamine aminopropyltransferase [Gammaproteobacteria bacterium]